MHRFYGRDFTELAELWGVKFRGDDDRFAGKLVRGEMWRRYRDNPAQTVAEVRGFLTALHEQSQKIDSWHPVWAGVLAVEHDKTMLLAVNALMETMWT